MYVDSHCHLAMLDPLERPAILSRAREAGVDGFLVPATSADDFEATLACSAIEPRIWSALGVHPHEASGWRDETGAVIRHAAEQGMIVAVGEIGLDFHYDHSPRDVQKDVLLRQIAIAREADLPVIVHNRESTRELLDLLRSDEARGVRGVIHSFTETAGIAREFLDLGFYISFSGIVTFRSADSLREAAKAVPLDAMLLETDSPYLAPVPMRGRSNEPSFVTYTAARIAELHGVDTERVAEATTRSFERLFRVEVSQ